jgi:hypothetical protein
MPAVVVNPQEIYPDSDDLKSSGAMILATTSHIG